MPLTRIRQTAIGNDSITTAKLDDTSGGLTLPGVEYVKVPVGTTAQRPSSAAGGEIRYNTDFDLLEQYNAGTGLWQAIDSPPTITTLSYSGSNTATDPAGGETITLTGLNFQSGATVTIGGTSASSVTIVSSTSITFTTPVKSAGDYDVVVQNSNGLRGTLTSGITYNGTPNFTTNATLSSVVSNSTINITIVAEETDGGTVSYSETSGTPNPLPNYLSLDSGTGVLSGTAPTVASDTTYNFEITATDDESQTTDRTFNLTVLRLFYTYQVPSSWQVDQQTLLSTNHYIERIPSSSGNRNTWTWSGWIKPMSQSAEYAGIFGADNGTGSGGNFDMFTLEGEGYSQLCYRDYNATNFQVRSDVTLRDTLDWHHVVLAVDTTQATASDRIKIYLNGVETPYDTTNYPTQNYNTQVNNNVRQIMGVNHYGGSPQVQYRGYISEVHFVDGQQLTPTSFGETYNNVWIPKDYTGSYGSNGWHLPMRNESIEGWSMNQYVGTALNRDVNGTGFSPDLSWFKWRDGASGWEIHDTLRHVGNNQGRRLRFDNSDAESSVQNGVRDFLNDGHSLDGQGGGGESNGVNREYVVWNWDAGSSAYASNTDGTITSTLKANDSYGFSIVGYTGTGANATIGHGLSAAPEWIIIKNRSAVASWAVYHTSAGADYSLAIDTNAGKTSGAAMFNASAPDANVFNVGSNARTNGSSNSMIAYCWRPITGYSKFGTYSGTGSAGNTITGLGFAPALVIIKRSDTTGNWVVFDHLRSPVSRADNAMSLDINDREYTAADGVGGIDWGTDGFTLQDNHSTRNASGGTYLYMAFADTSSYLMWKDYSNNGNHWDMVNTGPFRISNDSPTGEF
jgi:hypothetical protein